MRQDRTRMRNGVHLVRGFGVPPGTVPGYREREICLSITCQRITDPRVEPPTPDSASNVNVPQPVWRP